MKDGTFIRQVHTLDTRLVRRRWPWAEENRADIDAFWQKALAAKPKMFNGRVLIIGSYEETPDRSAATYFETDFASFLCWGCKGFPDPEVANGFALAALRSSDGAYICGVMAEHTANAGKIYFPGGTPDLNDVRPDGTVDFLGSVLRELEEETGLRAGDVVLSDEWIVLNEWPLVAYLKLMQLEETAEQTVSRLNANLASQEEPELAGFHIVRNPDDIDGERMPVYLQAFFRSVFADNGT